jgi:hypothetical protein
MVAINTKFLATNRTLLRRGFGGQANGHEWRNAEYSNGVPSVASASGLAVADWTVTHVTGNQYRYNETMTYTINDVFDFSKQYTF